MELLLVRHGKAQQREDVSRDRERKLVPKAHKQLKEDIPYLREYLKGREKVYLWSSRVVRAMETAEIIKNICKIEAIEYYDFIETGDFYELEESVKEIEAVSTIIIVGHQPYLSQWSRVICKKTIDFDKGSAVSFEILPTEKLAGEIKWFAGPGEYKHVLG